MSMIQSLIRLTALLWTLLITALIGNVIASNVNARSSATKAINYTMFVAAWSWVACLYGLAAAVMTAISAPLVLVFFDALAVLFTFVGGILLAAKLGTPNCSDIGGYGRGWIAYGSHDDEKRCREIQASTAFMWFLWATFTAVLFFTIKDWRGGLGGSRTGTKLSMAQVRV